MSGVEEKRQSCKIDTRRSPLRNTFLAFLNAENSCQELESTQLLRFLNRWRQNYLADRNCTMIALNHDGTRSSFMAVEGSPCNSRNFLIFDNRDAIQNHCHLT